MDLARTAVTVRENDQSQKNTEKRGLDYKPSLNHLKLLIERIDKLLNFAFLSLHHLIRKLQFKDCTIAV